MTRDKRIEPKPEDRSTGPLRAARETPLGPSEIAIGVSRCVLGEKVRYDGGHKRNPFVTESLGSLLRLVGLCPEEEIGLGVPRETVRLEVRPKSDAFRMVAPESRKDHTRVMRRYARDVVSVLRRLPISGYVLKRGSPSCGLGGMDVFDEKGRCRRDGRGLLVEALLTKIPDLPVEESDVLDVAWRRDNFIVRIFAYARMTRLFAGRWTRGDLLTFHAGEALVLRAHDWTAPARLLDLIESHDARDRKRLSSAYRAAFMAVLKRRATPAKGARVLRHIAARIRPQLDPSDRDEISDAIAGYRGEGLPLLVPLTLLRHHLRRAGLVDVMAQSYVAMDPREEALRFHA